MILLLAIITVTINSNHIGVYTRDIKGMRPKGRAPERLNQVIPLIRIQRLLQEVPGQAVPAPNTSGSCAIETQHACK